MRGIIGGMAISSTASGNPTCARCEDRRECVVGRADGGCRRGKQHGAPAQIFGLAAIDQQGEADDCQGGNQNESAADRKIDISIPAVPGQRVFPWPGHGQAEIGSANFNLPVDDDSPISQ